MGLFCNLRNRVELLEAKLKGKERWDEQYWDILKLKNVINAHADILDKLKSELDKNHKEKEEEQMPPKEKEEEQMPPNDYRNVLVQTGSTCWYVGWYNSDIRNWRIYTSSGRVDEEDYDFKVLKWQELPKE